ncbi:MAG: SGNH family hydrolase, partial [Roseiarcus sp.]
EPGTPGGAPVQPTFFIDVLGDSLGVLTASGLTEAFADKPEIAVADKSREASGLVRDDYYDWTKAAHDLATGKDHVNFVVMMVGINDLQPMRDGADTLDPLSDRWRALYGQRVEAVVAPFQAAHIPVAWVGLPPMRTDRLNAEVVKLNEIDREHAEKAGAKYIDIWDAFADENGQYDAYGPNVDGQNVKLRGADGILFTKAGARKVAHFLEAEIKRVFDKDRPQNDAATLPPDIEQAAGDINAQIRREMGAPEGPGAPGSPAPIAPPKPLAGPILSLTALPVSPDGALAAREATPAGEPQAVARVLRFGEPVDPRTGRADDFSWPRL